MDDVQKRLEAKRKHMYYEAYREYWMAHGLCCHCGREKQDPRYKTCERCRKKSIEYNMKYKDVGGIPRKEYIKDYAKKRRDRLISEGLCYVCGKEPPIPGRRWCAKCAERALAYQRKKGKKENESAYKANSTDAESD